jgi:hypothetical protein
MFFKKTFCSSAYRRVFALLIGPIFFISDYGKNQISYLATAGCLVYLCKANGDKSCKTRRRKYPSGENQ